MRKTGNIICPNSIRAEKINIRKGKCMLNIVCQLVYISIK